jgi:hypothetical protein
MSVLKIGPLWRSVEGLSVKRTNQMQMYRLGALHRLREVNNIADEETRKVILRIAKIHLMQFVEDSVNADLVPGAVNRANELLTDVDNCSVTNDTSTLVLFLTRFETSLDDDLTRLPTYLIERVGAYSVDQLIASADNVFPKKVQKKLPTEVIDDFKSAGACLAYEQPTACGFHVYRAAEGMLRAYCNHFGASPSGSGRDWGRYIRALRDIDPSATNKPNKRTVELLDTIRAVDRNPLAHPELSLDNDGALMAFDLCKNAISLMVADII